MSNQPNSRVKVVVITGAAAGVGRAVATRFAREGVMVGLIARDAVALESCAQELRDGGTQKIAVFAADVSDAVAVEQAASHFESTLGPIDLWVNDAMLTVFSLVKDITPEEFRRVTEVTYLGVVHGCMAALKHMLPRGKGHIINIGSALAYRGIPLQSAYCGAKHAIRGFTGSLISEMDHAKSGIAVSIMELPAMNTPQFDWARTHMPRQPKPMGTIYQPEVAAEAVFRAASTRPREYWVGLSTALTVVGNMILPNFMDWYLGRTSVQGQETAQDVRPDRQDNLFAPVTALHRTHGVFGAKAKSKAIIWNGSFARVIIVSLGALIFFVLGALLI
jgi:short-subunit dehydrogenase